MSDNVLAMFLKNSSAIMGAINRQGPVTPTNLSKRSKSLLNLKRNLKFALALLALMVLMMAAYGFAASNTVGTSAAGDGSAAISGYTISNIHYNLNATNPASIDSMTFTIAPAIPAGGAVHVKLISTGTTYTSCTVSGGTNVTCTFAGGVSVLSADELRVIAAQ